VAFNTQAINEIFAHASVRLQPLNLNPCMVSASSTVGRRLTESAPASFKRWSPVEAL